MEKSCTIFVHSADEREKMLRRVLVGVRGIRECGMKVEQALNMASTLFRLTKRRTTTIWKREGVIVLREYEADRITEGLVRIALMVERYHMKRAKYWHDIADELGMEKRNAREEAINKRQLDIRFGGEEWSQTRAQKETTTSIQNRRGSDPRHAA